MSASGKAFQVSILESAHRREDRDGEHFRADAQSRDYSQGAKQVTKALLVLVVLTPYAAFAGEPQKVSVPREVTWTATPNAVNTSVQSAKKVTYDKTTGKIRLK